MMGSGNLVNIITTLVVEALFHCPIYTEVVQMQIL